MILWSKAKKYLVAAVFALGGIWLPFIIGHIIIMNVGGSLMDFWWGFPCFASLFVLSAALMMIAAGIATKE